MSGSIEGDEHPTFRAHTELYEETQLRPPLLELVRPGPTLTFFDKILNTRWKVHPFLFALSANSTEEEDGILEKLKIDWEHTMYKWINPEEIQNYQTVPKLEKAWRRVWLRGYLDVGLDRLKSDRIKGASELALEGLGVLRKFFDENYWRDFSLDEMWEEILVVGWHIAKNGRPTMSAGTLESLRMVIISTLSLLKLDTINSDRECDHIRVGGYPSHTF